MSFRNGAVVVLPANAVCYSLAVSWASLPFPVTIGSLITQPNPTFVVLYAYEAVHSG